MDEQLAKQLEERQSSGWNGIGQINALNVHSRP